MTMDAHVLYNNQQALLYNTVVTSERASKTDCEGAVGYHVRIAVVLYNECVYACMYVL